MVMPLLKETILRLENSKTLKLSFPLQHVVRIIDKKGITLGLLLDKQTLEELEEELDTYNPEFLASLEISRKSGRVSGKEVKKKACLA